MSKEGKRDIAELKRIIERRKKELSTAAIAELCELLEGDRRYK